MKTAATIIAHPTSDKLEALKAFMEALKIKFEITPEQIPHYNDEFVAAILEGEKDRKEGRGKKITVEELDQLWK